MNLEELYSQIINGNFAHARDALHREPNKDDAFILLLELGIQEGHDAGRKVAGFLGHLQRYATPAAEEDEDGVCEMCADPCDPLDGICEDCLADIRRDEERRYGIMTEEDTR